MDQQPFPIDDPGYTVITLGHEQRDLLQQLYERCSDFVMLVEGQSVSPDAAEETFQEAPPGRSLEDKFVYGALDGQGQLAGVLEGMRHYPDKDIWWIGLLLLAPEVRGRGLGGKLVRGFEEYVRSEKGTAMMLGVVEENQAAYRFWQGQDFELVRQTEPRQFGNKVQTVYVMRKALKDIIAAA